MPDKPVYNNSNKQSPKMKIAALLISVLFTSCATLVNTNYTNVNLYSKQDSVKVYFSNTSEFSYTPTKLVVERSKEPLFLTLEKDSIRSKIIIPGRLSPEFWFGNIFNGSFFAGYLIDLSNNKRFKYPGNVYCDINSPYIVNYRFKPSEYPTNVLSQQFQSNLKRNFTGERGTINLKLSIPEGNSFVINKETHIGNTFGFLGITSELDYYYKDKKYFGIGAGTLTDFIIPFPAPYDVMGEYERSFGSYLDILHGFDIHRFSFNYGMSISKYSYYKRITEELYPNYVDSLLYSKKENRIGLSFSSKFKITNYFNCGIKYVPSLCTLKSNEFRYGHFLFLDIAINLEIKTK